MISGQGEISRECPRSEIYPGGRRWSLHRQLTNRSESLHEGESPSFLFPSCVSLPPDVLFLPPTLEFRFAFFCHFSAILSSLRRDFDIRAHARVLTSYYSGIPSRSARLRTRFASIMRNVYPTNGVPIPCRKRTRTGSRGAREKKRKKKKKGTGCLLTGDVSSYDSFPIPGDRTNLKSAGSRR